MHCCYCDADEAIGTAKHPICVECINKHYGGSMEAYWKDIDMSHSCTTIAQDNKRKNRILSIIGLCMIFLPIVAAAILVISVVIWRVYLMAGWLGIIGLIGTAIYFILAIYLLNRNDDNTRRYGKSAIARKGAT